MIPASDLYRIPRATSRFQTEELLRYARLEHGAENLAWAVPASPSRAPRSLGIREWFASHIRLPRTAASTPATAPLRPGLAAIHFNDEVGRAMAKRHPHAEPTHAHELLAGSPLVLPVQPHEPGCDETCTYEA